MMEIEFSLMEGYAGRDALLKSMAPLVDEFQKEQHVHVNITTIPWGTAWNQNMKYALYGHGPDVSALGTSWIGSLASMNALRPFAPAQTQVLGGSDTYFESIWRTGQLRSDPTLWAVPWVGDVRVLYYWEDILEEAGIGDFRAAFASDDALVNTLAALKQQGFQYPLAITTQAVSQLLHEAAHWVWKAGGDFISADAKKVTFHETRALEGLKKYFSLLPYVFPEAMDSAPAIGQFLSKKSPVHISGLWIPRTAANNKVNGRLGIAQLPGVAYIGGTSLAIWQYTSKYQQAFEFIRFLSSRPLFYNFGANHYEQLPTRREELGAAEAQKDVFNLTYLQAFQAGRSFPTLRLWGSIEDKLIPVLSNIWAELFANPGQDLDFCLHENLDPLANRLNRVLGS